MVACCANDLVLMSEFLLPQQARAKGPPPLSKIQCIAGGLQTAREGLQMPGFGGKVD